MIQIGETLISDLLVEEKFECDLSACKGVCCIYGDAGAPLNKQEAELLEQNFDKIKPYMLPEGIEACKKNGLHYIDQEHDLVTMLINEQACAFSFFENEIAFCAIEKAEQEGKIAFKKPLSCRMYPVRNKKFSNLEAVNYDEWDICKPAVKYGKKTGMPVYRFVQDALKETYGEEWYRQIEYYAENYNKKEDKPD